MLQPILAAGFQWELCAYFVLGLLGAVGLLAVVSPRRFSTLAARGGGSLNDHEPLLSFSRPLGLVLLAAVFVLGLLLARL